MKISKGLLQAYAMQDLAYETAMRFKSTLTLKLDTLPDKETVESIAKLGKLWKDAQEQIRIHRGKPLPGSLTHEKVKPARKKKLSAPLVLPDMPDMPDTSSISDNSVNAEKQSQGLA